MKPLHTCSQTGNFRYKAIVPVMFLLLIAAIPLKAGNHHKPVKQHLSGELINQDWGIIDSGKTARFSYRLYNDLPSKVTIIRVMTGDGGCYAQLKNKRKLYYLEMPPGSKLDYELLYDTTGKSGKITKTITIVFEDQSGKHYEKSFRVSAFIKVP